MTVSLVLQLSSLRNGDRDIGQLQYVLADIVIGKAQLVGHATGFLVRRNPPIPAQHLKLDDVRIPNVIANQPPLDTHALLIGYQSPIAEELQRGWIVIAEITRLPISPETQWSRGGYQRRHCASVAAYLANTADGMGRDRQFPKSTFLADHEFLFPADHFHHAKRLKWSDVERKDADIAGAGLQIENQ